MFKEALCALGLLAVLGEGAERRPNVLTGSLREPKDREDTIGLLVDLVTTSEFHEPMMLGMHHKIDATDNYVTVHELQVAQSMFHIEVDEESAHVVGASKFTTGHVRHVDDSAAVPRQAGSYSAAVEVAHTVAVATGQQTMEGTARLEQSVGLHKPQASLTSDNATDHQSISSHPTYTSRANQNGVSHAAPRLVNLLVLTRCAHPLSHASPAAGVKHEPTEHAKELAEPQVIHRELSLAEVEDGELARGEARDSQAYPRGSALRTAQAIVEGQGMMPTLSAYLMVLAGLMLCRRSVRRSRSHRATKWSTN